MTQKKSNLIAVRLTPRQMEKLHALSQQTGGLSVAEVVRSLVDHASLEPVLRPVARIPIWRDAEGADVWYREP